MVFRPKSRPRVLLGTFVAALCTLTCTNVSFGEEAAASAAPSPTPTASASVADPCGGDSRLLATLNRPSIGFSPCAIAKGTTVFEVGYQNNTNTGPGAGNSVQYTQDYTRFGVRDRFELDVIAPNYNRVSAAGVFTHGYNDAGLAFKYEFVPKTKFTWGVDGILTAATGSNGFSAGAPGYTGNLDVAYAASPAIGIGTTLALSSLSGFAANGNRSRYTSFMPSVVISDQFPNFYQLFVEYVYNSKIAPDLGSRTQYDISLQKLLTKRLEVDLEYGASLTPVNGAKFHYVGFGFGLQL